MMYILINLEPCKKISADVLSFMSLQPYMQAEVIQT